MSKQTGGADENIGKEDGGTFVEKVNDLTFVNGVYSVFPFDVEIRAWGKSSCAPRLGTVTLERLAVNQAQYDAQKRV